ncbi:MAG: hypothetical protein IKU62_08855 [Ruminiclostridium sp.]|nr:hypothetical protein [Ruminiclostridium sp.]
MRQTIRQTLGGLALMGAASVAILFAAWLTLPVPVVKDSPQTELLSIHVYRAGNYQSWYPRDMVQRQTARAIVDHMAGCREGHTLRRARMVLEEAPLIQLSFRTEDTYRVVYLGSSRDPDKTVGWTAHQDREGLAARVQDPGGLEAYILEQIGRELFPDV